MQTLVRAHLLGTAGATRIVIEVADVADPLVVQTLVGAHVLGTAGAVRVLVEAAHVAHQAGLRLVEITRPMA